MSEGAEATQAQSRPCIPLDASVVLALVKEGRACLTSLPDQRHRLALPLYVQRKPRFLAVFLVNCWGASDTAKERERAMLQGWLGAVSDRLRQADELACRRQAEKMQRAQATSAWETLLTVDQIARGLRIDKDPSKHQLRILEAAHT